MSSADFPSQMFKPFLDNAVHDRWLESYQWVRGDSLSEVRNKLGKSVDPGISRSHKGPWGVEVRSFRGCRVGVDLEWVPPGAAPFSDPESVAKRLGMSRDASITEMYEEWSCREAVFKAISAYGADNTVHMSGMKRHGSDFVDVRSVDDVGFDSPKRVPVRCDWAGSWVLCLARIELGTSGEREIDT